MSKCKHIYVVAVALGLTLVVSSSLDVGTFSTRAQEGQRYFPETRHTIRGRFFTFWATQGGLAQHGYPISEEFQEVSPTDGKTYMVQYFERAVFEHHPENKPPHDVLLSLLGTFLYTERYPNGAPNQHASTQLGAVKFRETGHTVGGRFLAYWQSHGGLRQHGYPISEEFQEKSPLDGKTYTVQYFQRSQFEYHPENAGTPYEVLLSQLGTFRYREQYGTPYTPTMPPASVEPTPSPGPQNSKTSLSGISMLSPSDGWVVGSMQIGTDKYRTLILHYRGGRWQQVPSPSTGDDQYLLDVEMISAVEGWAVGNNVILHYVDGKWQTGIEPDRYVNYLAALSMVSPTEGWAVGGGLGLPEVLHYFNGVWTPVTVPSRHSLRHVDMVSANDGWAVGADILHYTGEVWTPVVKPVSTGLNSVDMVSANDGWAVGVGGNILHYDGSQWATVPSPIRSELLSVQMLSSSDGWAVGTGGTILHYDGRTWTQVSSPYASNVFLSDLSMLSSSEGWAIGTGPTGATILHYHDRVWTMYRP